MTLFFIPVLSASSQASAPQSMKWIEGGTFWMGSDHGKLNERPAHQVTVDGFWMDAYPVTNAQYQRFIQATQYVTYSEKAPDPREYPGANPEMLVPASIVFKSPKQTVDMKNHYNWWAYLPGTNWRHPEGPQSQIKGREAHPVVHVTYDDALKYCQWTGKALPTEAQFEYAARGGLQKKTYTWGDQPQHLKQKLMNYWQGPFPYKNLGIDGYLTTSPVGQFPANGFGLYDMSGNVWEWVSDWYHPRYYEVSEKINPKGVKKEECLDPREPGIAKRIVKGGSFLCSENYCTGYRPSARMPTDPRSSTNHIGFRCVKNPS